MTIDGGGWFLGKIAEKNRRKNDKIRIN